MLALNKIYFIDLFYKETRTKISTKYTDIKRKGALILQELLQRESLTKQKSISTFFFTCSPPPSPKKHLGITCSRKCKCRSPHLTWPRTHPPATRTEGAQGWTRSWAGSGAGGGQGQLAQDQGQGPGHGHGQGLLGQDPHLLVKGYLLTQLLRSFKEQGRRPHFFTTVSLP